MNNHTPALTAEQWKRTTIEKRIKRLRDLKQYVKYCDGKFGSDCFQIRFACRQIENIRQSIAPESAVKLNVKIAVSMQTAQRMNEHGKVRGFTNVRSWFSKTRAGLTLGKVEEPTYGEILAFTVSCDYDCKTEYFALAELFRQEVCDCAVINTKLVEGLLDEALRRFEGWCYEKQALIDELKKFDKEVCEK